jgi:plastocyanin
LTVRARRRGWAAVLLAATGGLAGLGPVLLATAQPAWAFRAEAQMIETSPETYDFNPRLTRIFVGDRVHWKNDTPQRHTVTSDAGSPVAFDSGEVIQDGSYDRKFREPGTYAYHCKVHDNMKGVVEVTDPNAPTTTTAPPTTTTTTAPTTTTTARPTTTTTAPPTTTTTAIRPPAGVEPPPVPTTADAPPPTLASSSTTTVPSSTTTTVPPTTATTAPPPPAAGQAAPPDTGPPAPPSTEPPTTRDTGNEDRTAAGPLSRRDGKTDPATVTLVAALVAVGLFGAWTLIRVRPGRI